MTATFLAAASQITGPTRSTAIQHLLVFAVSFALLACAAPTRPWKVQLYPVVSPNLGEHGALEGEFSFNQYGHGPVRLAYYEGLHCSGAYNTFFDDESGQLILWDGANSRSVVGSVGRNVAHGTATVTCPDGTLIECAYLVNRVGSHGSGLCRDSRGGEYKLHF